MLPSECPGGPAEILLEDFVDFVVPAFLVVVEEEVVVEDVVVEEVVFVQEVVLVEVVFVQEVVVVVLLECSSKTEFGFRPA